MHADSRCTCAQAVTPAKSTRGLILSTTSWWGAFRNAAHYCIVVCVFMLIVARATHDLSAHACPVLSASFPLVAIKLAHPKCTAVLHVVQDYSVDKCRYNFTKGQIQRMRAMYTRYRASGTGCEQLSWVSSLTNPCSRSSSHADCTIGPM